MERKWISAIAWSSMQTVQHMLPMGKTVLQKSIRTCVCTVAFLVHNSHLYQQRPSLRDTCYWTWPLSVSDRIDVQLRTSGYPATY